VTLARLGDSGAARPAGSAARGWIDLLLPAIELAKSVASTDFVPRAMRNNPAAISAAILYGDEVGLGPMQSLARIAVIDGRPTLYAEAQRALVLAAGHDLWIGEITATRCEWCGRRTGSDQITRIVWTLDDARRAGLAGRDAWRKYPRQMLSARASAELVRAVFADVVGGLSATEEIEDGGFADAGENDAATPGRSTTRRRRSAKGTPAARDADELGNGSSVSALPALPGETVDVPADDVRDISRTDTAAVDRDRDAWAWRDSSALENAPSTEAQRRKMHSLMTRRGITERGDRLRHASDVIGRQITSSKELTADECDRVTDDLEAERETDADDAERTDYEPGDATE
jgi:hypothetical protein